MKGESSAYWSHPTACASRAPHKMGNVVEENGCGVPDVHGKTSASLAHPAGNATRTLPQMISLGEEGDLAEPGAMVMQSPSGHESLSWVAEALLGERKAIMEELERRHDALILKLEASAAMGSPQPQPETKPFEEQSWVMQTSGDGSEEYNPGNNGNEENKSLSGQEVDFQEYMSEATSPGSPKRKRRPSLQSTKSSEFRRQAVESSTGCRYFLLRLRMFVLSDECEVMLGVLIILNSIAMAFETQYIGLETAHELGWRDSSPADVEWPGAASILLVVEVGFGIIFASEVIVKVLAAPIRFVQSAWNWFDTLIVGFWVLSLFAQSGVNPLLLRLFRLARLTRLLRLVKTVQLFDVLHLLVGSLKASISVLFWSLFLLVGIMLVGALLFHFLLEPWILDNSNPYDVRIQVFQRYGTFSRAFVTMFETTLGNFIVPLHLLQEHVNEWYSFLFLIWICVVNFAVIQVIRAVFMHETFKVASLDDELRIMQKARQDKKHCADMHRFFQEGDMSEDGYLSLDEFIDITKDPRVKAWLASMEFDVSDAAFVFGLMGNQDGQLQMNEFIQGVSRLKGAARSMDMIAVQTMCRRIENDVQSLRRQFPDYQSKTSHFQL